MNINNETEKLKKYCFQFKNGKSCVLDENDTVHIYKHWDGYPKGADEFAAAFVAANKKSAGDLRVFKSHDQAQDISYRYEIRLGNDELYIIAFDVSFNWQNEKLTYTEIFQGTLAAFKEFANREEINE